MSLLEILMKQGDYIITGRKAYAQILSCFKGTDRVILYAVGRKLGYGLGLKIRKHFSGFKLIDVFKQMLDFAVKTGHIAGYRILDFNSSSMSAVVEIYGSAEALCPPPNPSSPVCMLLAGEIGGVATAITGEYIVAREIKCSALGHESCIFKIEKLGSRLQGDLKLAIVDLLSMKPFYVRELARVLRVGLGTVRWHLSYLERKRIVKSWKENNRLYYSLK